MADDIRETRESGVHHKNCQKVKLVKLLEILKHDTDENHPRTTSQFCKDLLKMGITCDRRTLKKDMDTLTENGYEVQSTFIGHEKAYYYEDRSFSSPEIKILMDAVRASTFITESKSQELIQRLADLAGSHRAQLLKESMTSCKTMKHTNESILYNIDTIQDAIVNKIRINFYYYSLDIEGKPVYHHDHALYVVDPLALIIDHENYYLMGYSVTQKELRNYRVDRMKDVVLEEDKSRYFIPICPEAEKALDYISDYREQVFSMFMGTPEQVTLEFQNSLKMLGVIYDRFGEDVKVEETPRGTLTITVNVQVSPTFFGWLFQFSDQMRILGPQKVVEEYEYRAAKVCDVDLRDIRKIKSR